MSIQLNAYYANQGTKSKHLQTSLVAVLSISVQLTAKPSSVLTAQIVQPQLHALNASVATLWSMEIVH